ncbi:hypothetical protein [Priestia aryabhattai]
MSVEQSPIGRKELERTEVNGISFGYKIKTNNEGKVEVDVLPVPDELEDFNKSLKYFNYETLMLLRSKYFFGIKQRAYMIEITANSFLNVYKKENKDINDFLTLQAFYTEMIMKLGVMLEDLAGMCFACKEYQLHGRDIAEVFLAYSDPISFYKSLASKKGRRKIKQIFNLPQSKGELNKIFRDLSEEETELLMEAIESSATLIHDTFNYISETIIRKTEENLTYNDIYNKTKHGFSPIYPFIQPVAQTIEFDTDEHSIEKFINDNFFEILTIMHDKLPGQRNLEEAQKYKNNTLATPSFTNEPINDSKVNDVQVLVDHITLIYRHLVEKYLVIAQGNTHLLLLLREDLFGEEESRKVKAITNDRSRYNI